MDQFNRASLLRAVKIMPNIREARAQLGNFIVAMSANRPNCDDAGMAREILADLELHGEPTRRHRVRLTKWCHTNGNPYQRGVPIARATCVALYDRVLPRED